ncbi:MAG: F0F1 ATP synthase subunit delta [bacterium]
MDESVDSDLLAGLRVRVEDTLMEYSVSDRLERMQQQLGT